MVTKLKEFRTPRITRNIVFLLAVLTITSSIVIFQLANLNGLTKYYEKDYSRSMSYYGSLNEDMMKVVQSAYNEVEIEDAPFYYCVWNKNGILSTNGYTVESFYRNFEEFYVLEDGTWTLGTGEDSFKITTLLTSNLSAYFAYPNEYLEEKQQEWDINRATLLDYAIAGGSFGLLGIIFVLFLLVITWKEAKSPDGKRYFVDRLYTDFLLLITVMVTILFVNGLPDVLEDNRIVGLRVSSEEVRFFTNFKDEFVLSLILFSSLFLIVTTFYLTVLLAIIRKWRRGKLIKHCAIYILGKKTYRIGNDAFDYLFDRTLYLSDSFTKSLYYRQCVLLIATTILIVCGVALAAIDTILFFVPVILEFMVLLWYWKGNEILYENIEKDMQTRLKEQMKSERMKVALITNVSHDLKTPLTSIISYTDLLAKEEGLSSTATDYIKILQAKSDRLKNIVTDLFDLARSNSGDIVLELDEIDLKKLLEQTLGELEDRIDASNLKIKTSYPKEAVYLKTDGKRLYRVFQNIIDNALKYSMLGSRVYLVLEVIENRAFVTIKNISAHEMNFTAEEIVQRFSRGDQARSEEGSGLGLSIADSFAKVCGGEMKVEIDGDLFKIILSFPVISKNDESKHDESKNDESKHDETKDNEIQNAEIKYDETKYLEDCNEEELV